MEYLFDDRWIDNAAGVTRVVNHPRKRVEALIVPDRPWESHGIYLHQGVIWDQADSQFKMWYLACAPREGREAGDAATTDETSEQAAPEIRQVCYATSADGKRWTKPRLGVHEFEGETSNNIVIAGDTGDGSPPAVIKDPDPNAGERRYKMMWYGNAPFDFGAAEVGTGVCVGFSRDGVKWPREARKLIFTKDELTDHPCLFPTRDPSSGKWVAYLRPRVRPKRRFVGYCESDDFVEWTPPRPVFVPEASDSAFVEFYGLCAQHLDGVYFGSLMVFHNNPIASPVTSELAYSRDNRTWLRAMPQEQFLSLGEPGSADSRTVCVNALIPHGDEWLVFYSGANIYHGSDYGRGMQRGLPPPPGEARREVIGLATCPRGHLCGLRAERDGRVETKYLFNYGRQGPRIWADVESDGFIQAEIMDHYGKVIPGWQGQRSRMVRQDDGTWGLAWGEHGAEGALGDASPEGGVVQHVVKLRFHLYRATLYGFAIGDSPQ